MNSLPKHIGDIWRNNVVLAQLLSLSPILAISQTAIKGIALALCSSLVLLLATLITLSIQKHIRSSLRFIWILFVTASLTTLLDTVLQLVVYPLHQELGIYVPLISCNLAIILFLEHLFQSDKRLSHYEILRSTGKVIVGLTIAITVFSALRELLAYGTVFRDLYLITANASDPVDIALYSRDKQFFGFALTQPGAFILLGLMIALTQWLKQKFPSSQQTQPVKPVVRARVTGKL